MSHLMRVLKRTLKKLSRALSSKLSVHAPLIEVQISSETLLKNFYTFKKHTDDTALAPVLKSNAYGHGLELVAQLLDSKTTATEAPFFVIDSYFEAVTLIERGIRRPILVIGYTPAETIIANKHATISFTITSLETLEKIVNTKKITRAIVLHLKVDTGMHRQGIPRSDFTRALDLITMHERRLPHTIVLDGVCTHFADADSGDETFTQKQIAQWNTVASTARERFPHTRYYHASATAGQRFTKLIDANVIRLGIGLYLDTPALELRTVISSVKRIHTGDTVGYNGTFTAQKDMTIATIPAGYFEGVDRRLSNIGSVGIVTKSADTKNNERVLQAPIVGRVSMNITTVDVTHIPNAQQGTPVVVLSSHSESKNSVASVAKLCNTVTHEILVHIPAHLKRVLK